MISIFCIIAGFTCCCTSIAAELIKHIKYKPLLRLRPDITHGILNSNNVIQSEWSKKLIPLHNDVKTLQELIEIRDGYKECIGFTQKDINNFITNLCRFMFYLFFPFLY